MCMLMIVLCFLELRKITDGYYEEFANYHMNIILFTQEFL